MFTSRIRRHASRPHTQERQRVRTPHQGHFNSSAAPTRLQSLITDCMADLRKLPIDRQLKSNVARLDDHYRSKIHDEIIDEFDALPNTLLPDESTTSKTRAQGWELICALQSARYFLDNYDVTWPRMNLRAAINPHHLQELTGSFQESFIELKQEDRLLLAATIAPEIFNDLGVSLNADEKKAADLNNRSYLYNYNKLNFEQLIALLDYAHFATGTFNGVNRGMRVCEHNRIRTIADVIYCVQQPLAEALTMLLQKKEFLYTGNLIKGIQINDPGGPLKRAKLRSGNLLSIPHPTSTTSEPLKSYAQRDGYDSELVFLNTTGIKIHLFHNKLTIDEQEVLLPSEVVYHMIEPDQDKPKKNGSIERFYCQPLQTVSWGPDPMAYV